MVEQGAHNALEVGSIPTRPIYGIYFFRHSGPAEIINGDPKVSNQEGLMKRWTIETVTNDQLTLVVLGYHENRVSPRTQFRVVLEKNLQEQGLSTIYCGRIVTAEGTTANTAARLTSHLAATGQLHGGVTVVV